MLVRCMASSLVRTGFVRGSMTQGNGCYQHRCMNNTLEVKNFLLTYILYLDTAGELICPAYHELCSSTPVPINGRCPGSCSFNGDCINGECHCFLGFHGDDCSRNPVKTYVIWWDHVQEIVVDMVRAIQMVSVSAKVGILALTAPLVFFPPFCLEPTILSLCYTCQNSSSLLPSLSICSDVLARDVFGQHCAPSEPSILQQLEAAVVMPNYNRLLPGGRTLFNILDNGYCAAAAKRLACWISIQRCDKDGDNRLRVCHSACRSYNAACGAGLDCSDQTLFSSEEKDGQCTGYGEIRPWWIRRFGNLYLQSQRKL
ncbi:hypothetical protein GW17_00055794 [Ensete ventricosum]|nr:hypothetical protein GW17_00055794 [Ensete ventricosum]